MNEPFGSPFADRVAVEWIDSEITLHDSSAHDVGRVVEANPEFIVMYANTGLLGLGEPRPYFIPREFIGRIEDNDWYLTIDRGQVESMGWQAAPAGSAWSDDWADGEMAYDLHPWSGRTRVRRLEDAEASAGR